MSPQPGDAWIDDELRNVALPADLLPKLHAIAALDDAELDRALRDVAPPPALLDRLRSIGSRDELDVDDELRHVVLPVSLAERLRRIPSAVRRSKRTKVVVRRFAIAASLLLAMGVGYLAAISPALFNRPRQQLVDKRPLAGQPATNAKQPQRDRPTTPPAPITDNGSKLVQSAPPSEAVRDGSVTQPRDIEGPAPATSEVAESRSDDSQRLTNDLGRDPLLPDVLAAGVAPDRLPPLESMPTPMWRGVTPPRVRGYDLRFQLTHGVHPFASPAANPALETCPVPLVTSSASFDATVALVAEQRLPPPHRIRTEEFLAAMDYGFPLPEGSALGIRTAIGPSPFGTSGSSLLQVAAQGKALSRGVKGAWHVVAILDTSASMRWENRWETARLGLRKLIERMTPADRVSIVLMGDKAEIVAERQSPAEALRALEALPDQPSARAVNVVDAVEMANEAAVRGAAQAAGRVVLLTDGQVQLNEPVNLRIESVVQAVVNQGHRFEVLDLREDGTIDSELNRIAAAANGKAGSSGAVSQTSTADWIRWRLLEIADGQSQVVAANATMKVTFKPDAVAMYRLLGHEATSFAALVNTTVEADLRAGEAATGLFEVILKPDGGETIATVEVTWRDPKTGAEQSRRQTVSRLQLAPSFHQAPLSLQTGALAAQTAEILRNSFFAPAHSHSLSDVAELSVQLNPRLRERPSFAKLMTLIEQAQRSGVVSQ
ncbi:MAG: VWA domain-containing protein [Pirellulales bacterium]